MLSSLISGKAVVSRPAVLPARLKYWVPPLVTSPVEASITSQRFAAAGDPYPRQCEASAQAIAQALDLPDDAWTLSYQSRFGRERWLEPATTDTLAALAGRGVRRVDVVAPGFAVDCLETLEEVAMMLAEEFAARGGELRYIPCLNESPAHAAALAGVVRRELAGWG